MNKEDAPEGAHWHTVVLANIEETTVDRQVLEARPTLQEARDYLAAKLEEDSSDGKLLTAEEKAEFHASVRAGEADVINSDDFLLAIYPCTGDDEAGCGRTVDRVSDLMIRNKAISAMLCPCPKHAAARALAGGPAGLLGLATARPAAPEGDDSHTGMYL